MNSSYILKINSIDHTTHTISETLQVTPTSTLPYWELAIKESDSGYHRALNYFLDLIESKILDLQKIGVQKSDLSVWYLYEYEEQCNMEFHPEELKRLGDCGIILCISCWEAHS